jgi:nicotinate-nucleotide pyrophosphorylase (carboxylating)
LTRMSNINLSDKQVDDIIDLALNEDLIEGDATSEALIPPDLQGKASIIIVENGVLAGGVIMARVFKRVDSSLEFSQYIEDGTTVKPGDIVGTVSGSIISILKAERVALNLLQRLSGVATETSRYVAEIRGCKGEIYDTRKTTPGMRLLEKYAVKMGGGENHRMHLGDAVLIKDNHIAALRAEGLSLTDIIARAKQNSREGITIEIEVTTAAEAAEAAQAGVDIIMLDNMSSEEMKKVVDSMPAGIRTEASGNITLKNVKEAALSGVDIISIGALTHSYKSLDIRIEYEA